MLKILSVFGTRPEAIKMAPVVQELARYPDRFISKVCVTAQHRQMLDQVLSLFQICPDYDLDIMRRDQSLNEVAAAVLSGIDPILKSESPDWILVQGDTTTVMAASLAAFYRRIKVGHVEAGLRSFDKQHPYPEEINRRIASVVADLHFAPSQWAADNLRREGIPDEQIALTGNPVIDAIRQVAAMDFELSSTPLADLRLDGKKLILVTAHRRENFGTGMEQICLALKEIADAHPDIQIVYPVHLNPNVQEPVYRILASVPNIALFLPLDYQPLVWLLKNSYFVITDSGGIQEEALGLGKPILVLREVTERPEAVEAGTALLVGAHRTRIVAQAARLLTDNAAYSRMAHAANPYGDGDAAHKIVAALARHAQAR